MNCSINTECQSDSLMSAIREIVDARDETLAYIGFSPAVADRFFSSAYPRLSDAINHAGELVAALEENIT